MERINGSLPIEVHKNALGALESAGIYPGTELNGLWEYAYWYAAHETATETGLLAELEN
jgi:hypothetical protein